MRLGIVGAELKLGDMNQVGNLSTEEGWRQVEERRGLYSPKRWGGWACWIHSREDERHYIVTSTIMANHPKRTETRTIVWCIPIAEWTQRTPSQTAFDTARHSCTCKSMVLSGELSECNDPSKRIESEWEWTHLQSLIVMYVSSLLGPPRNYSTWSKLIVK